MTYKIGDQFKFRFANQHMWFEVVEDTGDSYRAKLLNEPVRDGHTNAVNHWGDIVTLSKQDVQEYNDNRRGVVGVVAGGAT